MSQPRRSDGGAPPGRGLEASAEALLEASGRSNATIDRTHVYSVVLTIHSWLRWAALLFGAIATFNAFRRRAEVDDRPRGQRWDWVFMLAIDLEVLCGLLLYFGL